MLGSLKVLLKIIINKYLIDSYCVTTISDGRLEIDYDNGKLPFIHHQFTQEDSRFSSFILNTLDAGCSDYVIIMENPQIFMNIFESNIHKTNQRRGDRKLIFLPNEETSNARETLIDLLTNRVVEFVPDILLIIPSINKTYDEDFELVTQEFVGLQNNNQLLTLDYWDTSNETFVFDANLFPDKISNMQGRILKAATFDYKPYSIFELDENNEIIALDGTEMRTAIEYCNWSNCTINIIRDDEHEWGEIWDNRTGNGIMGNVVMDKADIGYGALYSWYHDYQFLDLSMPVVRTGITCIAPSPRLVASYLLPVLPFNRVMWGCVLASIIYSTAAMYFTSRTAKRPFTPIESLLGVMGIIVSQSPSVKTPPPALRQVINLLFLFTLMLSNVYSSGLASSVTVPLYEAPINTVQDLVQSGIDWGATHDAWIFSILSATEPEMVYLVNKFKKWPGERLKSRGKTRDFAYSVERLPAGHFAIGEYVTEEAVAYLQLMTEDIYWEQCVLMTRKSSPFTRRLNKLLGRLHQSGLLYAWETQVVLKYSNYAVQLGVRMSPGRHGDNDGPRPLGTSHFQGPIFIWAIGLGASAVTLIGEIVSGRNKRKQLETT